MPDWLYPLLRCPVCRERLVQRPGDALDDASLEHADGGCGTRYPVVGGIPRLLVGPTTANAVIAGFDDEWRRFHHVGTKDHQGVYQRYFDLLPAQNLSDEKVALDAGCGAGRWAFEVSRRGPRVIAVDLGQSIEVARANTHEDRVACVQADLQSLPLGIDTVDWAYSLGVLHHTEQPEAALAHIVRAVRPGGPVLLYLYYAQGDRGIGFRAIFGAVDFARRIISRQPRPVVVTFSTLIAAMVYLPLARIAAVFHRLGAETLGSKLPLSFYRDLSFRTMRNDSVDRFGTTLERRYSRQEMVELMRRAGLVDIVISESPPFWHGIGVKPA